MRAAELLARQFVGINQTLHGISDDLTADELTTRILPHTNLLAFDLWHVARTQDWVLQTLVRGVPEMIDDPCWQGRGRLVTHGIGVGMSEAQADELARQLVLADILEYADTVHQAVLTWLSATADDELTREPDIPVHLQRYSIYLEPAMCEEVPWMFQHPQVWRCLMPALGHVRDHLAQVDLRKQQRRVRKA